MRLDDIKVAEFQALYEGAYGKSLDIDEARELAVRALVLYDLLLRPLPNEGVNEPEPGDESCSAL